MKKLVNALLAIILIPSSAFCAATGDVSIPTKASPTANDKVTIGDAADINSTTGKLKSKDITLGSLPISTATQSALDGKAGVSCFANAAAFNACFPLDWPTGFDVTANYTVTGAWDFSGATVIGISGGSMTWPASDSAYYAARNGVWTSLSGVFASALGSDDNYVTDAEKVKLGNLSGINTGDQDLSGFLSKTNTTAFSPTGDYHPATKKYVDDAVTAGGGYTDEQAQDAVGGMFSGNTETGIAVTYNDTTGKVDFVVATQSDVNFTSALNTKLAGIAAGAEVNVNADWNASSGDAQILNKPAIPVFPTCTNDEDIMEWDTTTSTWVCKTLDRLAAGTGITITENGGGPGVDTVNVTPSTYQAYDADWLGVTANGASLISAANYATMRALLDLEVGVDFNAYDADLTIYAGITPSANVQSLLGAANYDAIRSLLDLEVGTDFNAYDADLTTWAGVTPGAGIATFLATPSGSNLASALTSALPASKGGTGLTAIGTGVGTALGNNAGAVGGLPTIIASGAYTVDAAPISANTCASAVAVTASGVATTDTIIATPNAILSTVAGFGVTTAGAVRVDIYPTSGNVNFQFCNPTGAAIDPGSVSFNWKVLR